MSTAAPSSASEMTAQCVNPVIRSTITVFETMLGTTPTRTGLLLKESKNPRHEISAVIGVTGKIAGTIVVSMSKTAAFGVLDALVGIKADEINSDVCDAVGELTNMIAGSSKAQMEKLELSISIPNIISGENHNVHYPSNVQPLCIEFSSDIGPFTIEVGFTGLG
ncbi:MAG: chemotaxis protein CheX [Planctomycetaceae bacterium]